MIENLNTSLNWNNLIPYRKDKNNLKVSITEKVKDNNNILSKPISKFEISVRTLNCFRNLNITILGQITELSEKYLLATPNFGKKSLEEIKSLLNHCGLKLNTKIDWSNSHPVIAESEIIEEEENNLLKNNLAKLLLPIDKFELSVRSMNCLKNDNIICLGDLVQRTESEMLRTPNFGRESLNEIKEVLDGMSLYFGMEIPNWPPDNYEELVKNYNNNYSEEIKFDFETLTSLVNKKFNEREKIMYEKRFCEKKTLEHIAKIFGVTKERVRQIEAKMIRKNKRYKENFKKFLNHERNYIFFKISRGKNLITPKTLESYKKQTFKVLTEKDLFINFCLTIVYENVTDFLNNEFHLINKSQFIKRKTAGRSRVDIINAWRKESKQIDNKVKIKSGVFKLFSNN